MNRFAWILALALFTSPALAGGPTCALLDPSKTPQGAILEAKLLGDPAATWVERAKIDALLKEQQLLAAFGPQGVSDRVKLGKLLKADLLVFVRPAKDAKEPALEITVSETAGGLRLLVRGVAITKDADADVAALQAAIRDGIKKHGETIREVLAVPPFVSNDLEFTFDYLKGAYAKLAEAEALDRPGVVVVELAEAEALAKELALAAPGTKLDRPLPVYLLCEYRHDGKGKDRTITFKLRAARGATPVGKPETFTGKPEESPAAVRKWAASTIDAIQADGKPRPPADSKAESRILVERARVFSRLGNWSDAVALIEASLALDPEQPEVRMEALRLSAPLMKTVWRFPDPDPAQIPRMRGLYRRGLEHMEALIPEKDLRAFRERKVFDLMLVFFNAPNSLWVPPASPPEILAAAKEMLDERRAFATRILPRFVEPKGLEHGFVFGWIIHDLPIGERYEVGERILAQYQDLPDGQERAELYGMWLRGAAIVTDPRDTKRVAAERERYVAFLGRMEASKNSDFRAAAATLRKRLAAEPDYTKASPPFPGQVENLFQPVVYASESPRVDRVHGIIAAGPQRDVLWSASHLYLLDEKSHARSVWPPTAHSEGGISSARCDGMFVWFGVTGNKKAPRLLVLDPDTKRVWDVSDSEGIPRGKDEDWNRIGSARLAIAPIGPNRICIAGTFGRTWIAVASFDPAKGVATVKVIHEAREVQDQKDVSQPGRTTVDFEPIFMFALRGRAAANAPEETRVLLGRSGHLRGRPLLIDPDRATVTVLKETLTDLMGYDADHEFGSTGDAIYRLESDPSRADRNRVVRVGCPDFSKTVVVEGLPAGRGIVHVHGKQIHIARQLPRPAVKDPSIISISPPPPLWEWWTADLDGKNLRLVANQLPQIAAVVESTRFGLGAITFNASLPALGSIDFSKVKAPAVQRLTTARLHPDEIKGMRSEKFEEFTTIEFVNKSRRPVRIYWLDYQGKRQIHAELPPGHAFKQRAHLTHAWLVADADDNGLSVHRTEVKPQPIEIVDLPAKK